MLESVELPKKSSTSFTKNLTDMGSADLPRRTQAQTELSGTELDKFFLQFGITEMGDVSTAARRGKKV